MEDIKKVSLLETAVIAGKVYIILALMFGISILLIEVYYNSIAMAIHLLFGLLLLKLKEEVVSIIKWLTISIFGLFLIASFTSIFSAIFHKGSFETKVFVLLLLVCNGITFFGWIKIFFMGSDSKGCKTGGYIIVLSQFIGLLLKVAYKFLDSKWYF